MPDRYALAVLLGAGLGLRQGEIFGLAVEDVEFLRDVVHVRRQVKLTSTNKAVYAPPKYGRVRDVPLPESVQFAMAAHLERWPAAGIALPWRELTGKVETHELLLTTREGNALNRNTINAHTWKPALLGRRDRGDEDQRDARAAALLRLGAISSPGKASSYFDLKRSE